MGIYQLISSPETHEKKSGKTIKTVRKESEMVKIQGGGGNVLKFELRKSDKMRIYRLVSSPETHEKKSGKSLKAVRKESEMVKI